MKSYTGEVIADVYELRFAYSGRVAQVSKKVGEKVSKGQGIAWLDRKLLQTELDRQLADYEKVRADFEIFKIKQGGAGDDTAKYMLQEKQAQLNASVKEVELAKFKMDMSGIVSPVDGIVLSLDGLAAGMYVTASSNPVKVLDMSSLQFVFDVPQSHLDDFREPQKVKISFPAMKNTYEGTTLPPVTGKHGTFPVAASIGKPENLLPGMEGHLSIS